jgi:outer membrane receptor protein involved in Fe transport
MLFSNKRLPLAAAITAFVAATPVAAQQLEEVIVTAQKRAENLQDVPISVSTVGAEKIQDNTIFNFSALADFVPSLHIAEASVNTNIYMRGIGSGNNRGFEQSVGMYLDGVYLGRGRQYRSALMDVERVEVLRGPQGTLFGKNTVAGAINITSASPVPGDEAQGEINASIEENGGQIYEGYIQGGTDTFAARLALRYRETDGYVYNAYLEQDEGALDETGGRLTLVWQPSDTFSANMKYTNMQRERDGANSATWRFLDADQRTQQVPSRSAFASIAYTLMDTFFPDFPSVAGQDFTTYKDNNCGLDKSCSSAGIGYKPDSYDDEIENFSLNMNWELGNGTLTSVTGWAGYKYNDDVDVDWLPLQFIDRSDIHDFEQFSQEIRWASDIGDRFTYTVGAYYDENELDMEGQVGIDTNFDGLFPQFAQVAYGAPFPNLLTLLTGGAYGSDQISRNHNFNQETESWAVFAQGTFEITDSLRVTGGLRYTEEEKDALSSQRLGDQNCASDPNRTEAKSISMTGACPEGYNYFLDIIQAQNFNTYNKEWAGSRKTDDLSPSLNLQWDMGDASMLYVSWSQGFKSGGFSAADDGEPGDFSVAQLPPPGGFVSTVPNADFEFDDESVDAIEIGGKHEFLDGRMRLNWAAFYSEYEDLQTTIFKGVGFSVKNAASSEVQGFEVDWLMQITDSLRLGVNMAYLDATYGDFVDGPCDAIQLDQNSLCGTTAGIAQGSVNDLTGVNTLYASDWSGNAFIDYRRPLGGMELFAGVDMNYRSEFSSAGDNDPYDLIDDYTKVNARIGLGGERWELVAYGRNIFDEVAYQQSFDTPVLAGSHTRFMEEGAVFGVRGTLRF